MQRFGTYVVHPGLSILRQMDQAPASSSLLMEAQPGKRFLKEFRLRVGGTSESQSPQRIVIDFMRSWMRRKAECFLRTTGAPLGPGSRATSASGTAAGISRKSLSIRKTQTLFT